jgi:hypothetical protein
MGWYTAYELEFEGPVDWDDDAVKHVLDGLNVRWLYLHDFETERVLLNLYSHHKIEEVLQNLFNLYHTQILYRIYESKDWTLYRG